MMRKRMLAVLFLLVGSVSVYGAAKSYLLDVNFDGHPDQLIPEEKNLPQIPVTALEVRLFDPASGKFVRDPVFSEYLTAGKDNAGNLILPRLNAAERSIQVMIGMDNTQMNGYKFFVRNKELCFYDGGKLPEKFLLMNGSPEGMEFDCRAGKFEYDQLAGEWHRCEAGLKKYRISTSRAEFAAGYNRKLLPPEKFKHFETLVRHLDRQAPDLCGNTESLAQCRNFLTDNRQEIAGLAAVIPMAERLKKPIDPETPLFDHIFHYGLYYKASRVFRAKMLAAAGDGDFAAVMRECRNALAFIVPAETPVHYLQNISVLGRAADTLFICVHLISRKRKLEKDELRQIKEILVPYEKFFREGLPGIVPFSALMLFDAADFMMKNTPPLRPDGVSTYLVAKELLRDKITAAAIYCRIMAEIERDPLLAGDLQHIYRQSSDFTLLKVFAVPDEPQHLLCRALSKCQVLAAAAEVIADGKAVPRKNPWSGREMTIDFRNFTDDDGSFVRHVEIHSFYRRDRSVSVDFYLPQN